MIDDGLTWKDKAIIAAILIPTFAGIPLAFITGNADWLWTLAILIFFWT